MDNEITVRPYQPVDRRAIREICYVTGFMGTPADWYWRDFESFTDIWTSYYTDREPESTFVAVRSGSVVGFLLGCVDSSKAPTDTQNILRQMVRRSLLFRPGTAGFFWRSIGDMLGGTPLSGVDVDLARYPSHLHIDLLPEGRGGGVGAALMHLWFERLAAVGSPGCHLGTLGENTNGIAFFERMGFKRLGPPTLIPGMRTPDGKRMHDQVMVREIAAAK
jgi:ribosomal protein S18 acetylase RimI-like enzyme